jgi:hypothetical protein
MNSQYLHTGAAVRIAFQTGAGERVVDVGFERAFVARFDVSHALADRENLQSQFVSGDARIGKKRHLAEIAREVGAANPHAVGAHQRFTGLRCGGIGAFDDLNGLWRGEFNGGHEGKKSLVVFRQTFLVADVFHRCEDFLHFVEQ